jgi:hypothetical protein
MYFCPAPGFVGGAGPRQDVYTQEELRELGRYAIIGTRTDTGANVYRYNATSEGYEHLPAGDLWLVFVEIIEVATVSLSEVRRRFLNAVGEVIEEILALSNVDGNLSITEVQLDEISLSAEDTYPTTYQEQYASVIIHYDKGQ